MKREHERLKSENNDLNLKLSKISKDIDQSKLVLEKSSQENKQTGNNADQSLAKLSDRLNDATRVNNELQNELKHANKDF